MIINAHIHLFDAHGVNKYYEDEMCVGFADVDDSQDTDYIKLYNDYINTYPINGCLLACGKTADEMISIRKEHMDVIRGYGEIKLYKKDMYNWDRDEFRKLLNYNEMHGNLPVMIHFDFDNDEHIEELKSWLQQYPDTPFIHCHCGCYNDKICDNANAITTSINFAREFKNYYFDISWKAADYLCSYSLPHLKLSQVANKLLLGTDTNIDITKILKDPDKYALKCKNNFITLNIIFGDYAYNNARILFHI